MEDTPKHFIGRLFGFSIGPLVSAFIGFLMVPVTTYLISPSELGKSSMFTMAFSISSLFIYLGMDQALVREFSAIKDKKQLFWTAFVIPFGFSIIIGILYLIFYKSISLLMFGNIEAYIIKLLAISLPFATIDRFNMLIIRMEEKAKLFSLINIINKLVNMIMLIIFLLFIEKSFIGIINATVLSLVIMCFIENYINKEYWKSKINFNIKLIKDLLGFGLPLVPASIITWIFNSMDKMAMRKWANFTEIGLYAAAFKIVLVLGILQQAFNTFWAPTAYRWYEKGVDNEKFSKVSKLLTGTMSIIFVLIVLFKDLIIRVLSPEYYKAAVIVPFLLFYPLMYTISETTTLGISISRKTGYNIIVSAISAVVNFIGNYILVPKYGALGASVSTGIAYIVFFWMRTLISRKLWFKFNLSIYFWNILFMFLMSLTDVIFNNSYLDLIFVLIILIINKYTITSIYKFIKELGAVTRE